MFPTPDRFVTVVFDWTQYHGVAALKLFWRQEWNMQSIYGKIVLDVFALRGALWSCFILVAGNGLGGETHCVSDFINALIALIISPQSGIVIHDGAIFALETVKCSKMLEPTCRFWVEWCAVGILPFGKQIVFPVQ